MQLTDIIILAVLLLPAIVGLLYGFLNIVLSIIAWGLALAVSLKFTGVFAPLLESFIAAEIARNILAFTLLFIATLVLLTAAGYFMLKLMGRTGLTAADRLLGLGFGVVLGAFIMFAAVFLAGFTDISRSPWWQQSLLIPPFARTAVWARRYLPEDLVKFHHYAGEGRLET